MRAVTSDRRGLRTLEKKWQKVLQAKVPKMYKFTDILHSFIKINNTLNIALTRPFAACS